MLIRQLFDRESSTYTYLLADLGQAVLIDPVESQVEAYLQLLRELDLHLTATVETHTHADHITGSGKLREATHCTTMVGAQSASECVGAKFEHGDKISFGKQKLNAIYTPGHTDDSYSFYLETAADSMLFTGDTLLIRGTGRTDFQNGSAADQYDSLFKQLLKYPAATRVYPGHDYKGWTQSSVGEELAHNPRLQVNDKHAYINLMATLNLPDPKLMDIAVAANLACGEHT